MRSGLGGYAHICRLDMRVGFADEWFASVHGVSVDLTIFVYAYRAR